MGRTANTKYEATVTIGGKRRHFYGRTKSEARAKAVQAKTLYMQGVRKNDKITVREVAEEWIKTLDDKLETGKIGDQWHDDLEAIARNWVVNQLGTRKISTIKYRDLEALLQIAKEAGIGASHGQKIMYVIKQVWIYAIKNEYISRDPSEHLENPGFKKRGSRRALTDEERKLVEKTIENHDREGVYYGLILYCGLRPQEAATLEVRDYDVIKRQITVSRARKAGRAGTVADTKTKAGRRKVPVPDRLHDKLLTAIRGKRDTDLICLTGSGGKRTRDTDKYDWRHFVRLVDIDAGAVVSNRGDIVASKLPAGFDELTPYSLRHTYADDLRDAGCDPDTIKRLMGHAKFSTTSDNYMGASDTQLTAAADAINRFHAGKKDTK